MSAAQPLVILEGVEAIAGMLMKRGTLSGEEIDAALPPGFMARPITWALALADTDAAAG